MKQALTSAALLLISDPWLSKILTTKNYNAV